MASVVGFSTRLPVVPQEPGGGKTSASPEFLEGAKGGSCSGHTYTCKSFPCCRYALFLGHGGKAFDLFHIEPEAITDAPAVIRVHFVKQGGLPELNTLLRILQMRYNVIHQMLSIHIGHNLAIKIARLHKVCIAKLVSVAGRFRERNCRARKPLVSPLQNSSPDSGLTPIGRCSHDSFVGED